MNVHRPVLMLLAVCALMEQGVAVGQQQAGPKPSTLVEVVTKHFTAWDSDGNGSLSHDEVDRLAVDPAWKGEDAAAIATLKLAFRSKKAPIESLTLAEVGTASRAPLVQDAELTPPSNGTATKKPDTLQARFARANKAINRSKRDLFLDPTPDLDKFRQGRIGDCFFVSIVGAMVERDPESVKGMIVPATSPEDGYTVTFADGQVVTVPPLTDAEFAMTSTTGDEGAWLPVIEKAFGQVRMSTKPEDQRKLSSTDAIARGGSVVTAIRTLTGHAAETIRLRSDKNPAAKADSVAFQTKVRARIIQALSDRRLVGAGTDDKPGVPGISPNHAYAILGFDESSDTLRIWNPHGNTFKPKGEVGTVGGYPTKAGRFEMPLADFLSTFRGISFETDRAPLAKPEASEPQASPVAPKTDADATGGD